MRSVLGRTVVVAWLALAISCAAAGPAAAHDGKHVWADPLDQFDGFGSSGRDVGIWFSTWYYQDRATLLGNGHGAASSAQMLGDVDGDGRADSIAHFGDRGEWQVALSDGETPGVGERWAIDEPIGSDRQFLADVDGDRKADAVAFVERTGSWHVALSSGRRFGDWTPWMSGHGVGAENQLVGDTDGDGRADAVVYDAGNWYVALSRGDSFGPRLALWSSGHGLGSATQMLGDVDGDGRADAVAFFRDGAAGGSWYVSLSNGVAFGPGYDRWSSGHGAGSDYQWLADVEGDARQDAVVAIDDPAAPGGEWYAASSSGGGFGVPQRWKRNLGEGSWLGVGDVDGDRRSDAVAFSAQDGSWRYVPAPYDDYKAMSRWNEWAIRYQPVVNGIARQYDSGDPAVIRHQLRQIASAGIDFLLLDLTNGIGSQPMLTNAQAVCAAAKELNAGEGPNVKVAVAVGLIQWSHSPAAFEEEARLTRERFLDNPACGALTYYHLEGKPLLVFYGGYGDRASWLLHPDHSSSSGFTVRFGQGTLPDGGSGTNPSRIPNGGCGTPPPNPKPPQSDHGLYVGWGLPYGTLPAGQGIATVMPGWNNHEHRSYVSRTQYGSPGGFYTRCGWDRVLGAETKPSMVVINSYNEFAEETAVEPADTRLVGGPPSSPTEPWPAPDYYWNLTKRKIAEYKAAP